jgi:hypothetical protein
MGSVTENTHIDEAVGHHGHLAVAAGRHFPQQRTVTGAQCEDIVARFLSAHIEDAVGGCEAVVDMLGWGLPDDPPSLIRRA